MFSDELKARTKTFALDVMDLIAPLCWPSPAAPLANQLLRSGTAIGAHYRSASKAMSGADFEYKIKQVEEEADESAYWLELLTEKRWCTSPEAFKLLAEANELTAMFAAISIKLKEKRRRPPNS